MSATQTLVFFSDANESSLAPARSLLKSSAEWVSPIPRSKTYDELMNEIEILKNETTKQMDGTLTAEAAASGLLRAYRRLKIWRVDRGKSSRKMGAWTQKWLTSFGSFLTNYSGIVEIMKGADSQYGGLAYGLLSVLLALPINKSQHEADIEQALEEFSFAFPRLENLKSIYSDQSNTLKRLITNVYTEVVLFMHECIDYFQGSSFERLKETAVRPPKTGIQIKVGMVRKLLAEIRWEAEVQMQRRIAELGDRIQQLQVAEAKRSDNERQATLSNMRAILEVDVKDSHLDTPRYRKMLDEAFRDVVSVNNTPCLLTLEGFATESAADEWMKSEHSGILVIGGQNARIVTNTTLNWLSYVPVLLSTKMASDGGIFARYYCQITPTLPSARRPSIRLILASWAYQITESLPTCPQIDFTAVSRAFAATTWQTDEDTGMEAAGNVLLGLLAKLDNTTQVVLVLDRADRCCMSPGQDSDDTDAAYFMQELEKLLKKAPCRLKILVTMGSLSGAKTLTRSTRKRLSITQGRTVIERLDWHQEALLRPWF